MIVDLYIGTDKLDLFNDEKIVVKSSIADSQDITKNTTDYSRDFTVPATDNNNNIFVHYYDANIDNTFDARIKVDGKIELDGVPFREGKWRLSKVNMKHGKASSYTLNFFGNLVSLKDKFKKEELKDLDLSAFEHDYNSDNVKLGLQSSLFSGDLVYNLLAKKRYYYSSDPTDGGYNETIANIAYNGQDVGVLWNDLRPAIRVKSILEAMETKYSITFSADFFGLSEFTNLYLWCNNDDEKTIGGGTEIIDWDSGDTDWVNLTTNEGTFPVQNTSGSNDNIWFGCVCFIYPEAGYETVDYTLSFYLTNGPNTDSEEVLSETLSGDNSSLFDVDFGGALTEKVGYWQITTQQEFSYTARWYQVRYSSVTGEPNQAFYNTYASVSTISSTFNPQIHLPKIKVMDFFKGLVNAFKLVAIPTSDTNIYVDTLDRYYSHGTLRDYTSFIDFESYDVERGDILNEINFNFQEPKTILNNQFKISTGLGYGDEETILYDTDGEVLDGTSLEVKLPFEQILYERLQDAFTSDLTNIQYGAVIDDKQEPTNNKPHIFYNVPQAIGGYTIGFIEDDDNIVELTGDINTASHTIDFAGMNSSFIFGLEYSTWNGQGISRNLYTNYWENYILSIFNIKRRNWIFEAQLPMYQLSQLQLNDVIQIKDNFYRIDNFDLDLTSGKAKLKLINSFENDLTTLSVDQTVYRVSSRAQSFDFIVKGTANYTAAIVVKSGTNFITVTQDGYKVTVDVQENTTGVPRMIGILGTNDDKGKTDFEVLLIQEENTSFAFNFGDVRYTALGNILLTGKA